MATLSTIPLYPTPGRKTNITFTLTESGSNYVRVWCTAAPPGSTLRTKLDGTQDPRNRVEVFESDGGSNHPWRFAFDKGGRYTFVAQEYTRGASSYGGGYQGATDGAPSETKVGSEATLTIDIGERYVLPVGTGADVADLVLWVWGDTIRATTIAVQGEKSPAIQSASPTPRMLAVIESSTVVSALTALAGVACSTAIGTISSLVSGYVTDWNAHLADATAHEDADADNLLPVGFSVAGNAAELPKFVNEALRKMRQHFTNDAVDGNTVSGRDSGDYHNVSGKKNDLTNMPIVESVGDTQTAYIGLADLYRCYEEHRVSTTVHDSADSTNVLPVTTTHKLFELHRIVLDILADTNPTAPATRSSGGMLLIQQVGGVEKPLEE
jgi:hypothetical protein